MQSKDITKNSHKGTPKNSGSGVTAKKNRTENCSLHEVNADLSTELTPLSRKKRILTDAHNLPLFYVFTSKALDTPNCNGNPAIVLLVDSLPTLKEHLNIFNRIENGDIKKGAIPEFITLVYISPYRLNNNIDESVFSIRWFSPTNVIKRCGHGTLAAAAFILNHLYDRKLSTQTPPTLTSALTLTFHSDSESLKIEVQEEVKKNIIENKKNLKENIVFYSLQLENELLIASDFSLKLKNNLNILRERKTQDDDGYLIIELSDECAIKEFSLTKNIIDIINKRALIITAKTKNKNYDIVFRYFAPFYGEQEDSATGSAASLLMPFWENHFFKNKSFSNQSLTKKLHSQRRQLRCYQASENGGFFIIDIDGNNRNLSATSNTIEVIGQITEKSINFERN